MPKVAADTTTTQKFFLKSAPPDGYIVVRKFNYGETLEAQKLGAKGVREGNVMSLRTDLLATQHYMFSRMILDHNLEDETGQKLDFKNVTDVRRLIPAVGEEIQALCEQMNESVVDEGNLPEISEKPLLQELPQIP